MSRRTESSARERAAVAAKLAARKRDLEAELEALDRLGGPEVVQVGKLLSDRETIYNPSQVKPDVVPSHIRIAVARLEKLSIDDTKIVPSCISQTRRNALALSSLALSNAASLSKLFDGVLEAFRATEQGPSKKMAIAFVEKCSPDVRQALLRRYIEESRLILKESIRTVNPGEYDMEDLEDLRLAIAKRDVFKGGETSIEQFNEWLKRARQQNFPSFRDKKNVIKLTNAAAELAKASLFVGKVPVTLSPNNGIDAGYFQLRPRVNAEEPTDFPLYEEFPKVTAKALA